MHTRKSCACWAGHDYHLHCALPCLSTCIALLGFLVTIIHVTLKVGVMYIVGRWQPRYCSLLELHAHKSLLHRVWRLGRWGLGFSKFIGSCIDLLHCAKYS